MALLNDIRSDLKNVSDAAIEQLADRFGDLPRPLLAAIGAGDLTVERLARLREQVGERFGQPFKAGEGRPSRDDVRAFASDLPGKAQKVAGDIAHQLEQFASEAPARAQQLIGELPARAQEFSNSLAPENLRATIESYTDFVAHIYDNLADRGGETVAKARSEREHGAASRTAGSGDDGAARTARTPRNPAAKRAPARKPAAKREPAQRAAARGTTRRGTAARGGATARTGRTDPAKGETPAVQQPGTPPSTDAAE